MMILENVQFEQVGTYIRGTTCEFKFYLPCNFTDLTSVSIYFWQKRYDGPSSSPLPIVKTLANCTVADTAKSLSVKLSQSESLRFTDKERVYVQFQGETSVRAIASKEERFTIYPLYDPDDTPEVVVDDDGYVVLDGNEA